MIHWLACRVCIVCCLSLLLFGCNKPPTIKPTGNSGSNIASDSSEPTSNAKHEGYIGSQACTECHEEISQQYAQHSMGRSAQLLDASIDLPQIDKAKFDADNFRYTVYRQGNDWIHHQGRIAKDGTEVAPIDMPVKHLIGSGNHGQSFLVEQDGRLLMSPITWYPDKQVWALSPGYEKNNSQFNRPVIENCLYCHTDLASAVPHTLNAYETPSIKTHAIGCERCHGPGEQHVAAQSSEDVAKDSIVNPGKLEPDLQEAVCQQCHLSGSARVVKHGRSLYDYRPGERLESAYTIFTVEKQNETETQEFVGHVEQMHASKCFSGSEGKLGCISCHDPHRLPSETERVSFYRDRCLNCHELEQCTAESVARTAASDNCVQCHMPSRPSEILHAAVTDHSVPRFTQTPDSTSTKNDTQTATKVVAFPNDEVAQPTPRDKAIALVRIGSRDPDLFSTRQLNAAQASLETTVAKTPDDIEALEALAELYLAGDEFDKAMRVCQQVLKLQPKREQTLEIVGDTYSGTGNPSFATSFWRRAIEVNPSMSKYWYKLGECYAEMGQWKSCLELAEKGKQRFPTSVGIRHLLLRSCFALGNVERAKSEFQELEKFRPKGFDSIERWYNEQVSAKKRP